MRAAWGAAAAIMAGVAATLVPSHAAVAAPDGLAGELRTVGPAVLEPGHEPERVGDRA
ncbi:hypothetical protein GCM10025876_19760 [Demequina litorisediminis]|uniref:Uncharacterized protein n=2 Tax=Demequina litorisediminis TaxID=1849022 RepID=A0ABQ6ID48_9MICO|nr:hypothetical protein GCM10025876_19760 [Demequina litorisediminis]